MQQIATVKQLRQELDKLTKQSRRAINFPSRAVSLFTTHLEEARMQLGSVLGALKEPNPYSSGQIVQATDQSNGEIEEIAGTTQEDKLHTLRGILEVHIKEVEVLAKAEYNPGSFEFMATLTGAYNSLRLAKNWLGIALTETDLRSMPQTPNESFTKEEVESSKESLSTKGDSDTVSKVLEANKVKGKGVTTKELNKKEEAK